MEEIIKTKSAFPPLIFNLAKPYAAKAEMITLRNAVPNETIKLLKIQLY